MMRWRLRLAAGVLWLAGSAAVMPAATPKFMGNIYKGNDPLFHVYWNQMTPENQGKWGFVEATRDVMTWASLDAMYAYCATQGLPVKQHTFVWGAMQYPPWITGATAPEQAAEIEEWIAAFGARYPQTAWIDVVNEPLHHYPTFAGAIGGAGATGWDWVIWSFEKARQYCPNAQLLINEFNVLSSYENTAHYLNLIQLLKSRGLIDGIGEQGHFWEGADPTVIHANLQALATAGLPIYISEMELAFANDTDQRNKYQALFPILWTNSAVHGITHWGYKQNTMWRADGYLLRTNGTARPAFNWLTNYIAANPGFVDATPPATPIGLIANPVSTSRCDLSWTDRAHNETGFRIERKAGIGGAFTPIASAGPNALAYSDQTTAPGIAYYYRLAATNAAGASPYSSEILATNYNVPRTGLVLWLAGDDVDGDGTAENAGETGLTGARVDTWTDKAGGDHNATRLNGNPALATNALNGKSVVRFSSANLNPGDYLRFPRIGAIRTVFWVVRETNNASGLHFLLGDDSSYHFHRGGVNGPLWNATYAHSSILNGTTRTNGTTINGTTTTLAPDTFHLISLVTAGNVQANQLTQDRTYHGSWQGDMAELLIYNTALGNADRESVEAYLRDKWLVSTSVTTTSSSSTTAITSTSTSSTTSTTAAPAPHAVPATGLALWLDATDLTGTGTNPANGSAVATWADKSGGGHPATQGTAASRPSLVANALGTNFVVRFDGDDWLTVGTLRATPGNLHAFVVSRRSAGQLGGDTYQRLLSTSDGADSFDWQIPDWTITSPYDGSGNSLAYGPDIRQAATTNGNLKLANLNIGRDAANGASRLRGDIAEVLVYTNALSPTDTAAVTNYLRAKWLANTNSPPAPRPLLGAIRWDAWVGTNSGVGLAVEKALGPAAWHARLPWFGHAESATQVVVRAVTQALEDRQIAYAKAAGLDYWAFVMYSTNDAMTRFGLDLYLASARRNDLAFCMIDQGAGPNTWTNYMARMLSYFTRTNHVTVLGGRPLFYMLDGSVYVGAGANQWASWSAYGSAFNQLRAAVTNAGLQNPYMVYMWWDGTEATARKSALGFDAISSYAINGNHSHASYATLDATARAFWNTQKDSGSKVVPNATVGWDRRPRVQNPVPWESWQVPSVGMDKYYAAPTPAELTAHLQAAVSWVQTYPATADANAILLYAWNEIDEGGWLLPTHTERTARLAALRAVTGASADADADAMDDLWDIWSFGAATNAGAGSDADGDGFPDTGEFRAGTEPTNESSRLEITGVSAPAANLISLGWQSVTGVTYRVELCTNATANAWVPLLTNTAAAGAVSVTVALPNVAGFMRVSVGP